MFFINSILLGIGLAMDAFSVSLVNGLAEPHMRRKKVCLIAGVFAFFQALMPMIGWLCVRLFVQYFSSFQKFIPWIAFFLLLFIGGNMLYEGLNKSDKESNKPSVGFVALLMQGVATSIDALSVGFTISEYGALMAAVCASIIAAVTFAICIAGLIIGRRFGTKLSKKATILGGNILILIGIEILLTGILS